HLRRSIFGSPRRGSAFEYSVLSAGSPHLPVSGAPKRYSECDVSVCEPKTGLFLFIQINAYPSTSNICTKYGRIQAKSTLRGICTPSVHSDYFQKCLIARSCACIRPQCSLRPLPGLK